MPLIREIQRGFESVPETEIQALSMTRPSLMPLVIASSPHMTFYQSALGDRLEYELTFNDYSRVIQATGDAKASYHIGGISLEYDMVTLPELA